MPQAPRVKKTGGTAYSGEDQSRYEKTPEGYQELWRIEFDTSDKELNPWRKQAQEVEKVYTDDRKDGGDTDEKRSNLFTADTINAESLLYGRTPQTDVSRKYQDANDDVGRTAATIMQRILNGDIERPDDRFAAAAGHALSDHLRSNFGLVRWRYDFRSKPVPGQPAQKHVGADGNVVQIPAVPETTKKTWEDVIAEYVHWRDVKWSPCRVWEELRWISFRVQMTRKQLRERFGPEGARVTLDAKKTDVDHEDSVDDGGPRSPWDRADVWEIWSKEHGRVFWYVSGWKRIMDVQLDPLQLKDFWPCPKPIVAWITTTRFRPKPEYLLAQDSYKAIDDLTTRIHLLRSALRVLGIYDENMQELQTLLDSTEENKMVPVANWSTIVSEKGGIEGVVSWFPLDVVIETLQQLTEQREREISLNHELTGHADVMRGALEDSSETATATRAKTKFASKRIQRKQDMFSEFVSRAQTLRAEIICKLYDPETIRAKSNIDFTEDAEHADDAIKLLKEEGVDSFRITVRSEALALPDFAEMKRDRTEFMTAMSNMVGALVKLPPIAMPILPELAVALKWYAAGFRGATEIEAAMDRMAKKLQELADKPPQQPGDQGDQAKIQAQQLKNQGDKERLQLEAQNRSQEIQQETAAEVEKQKAQMIFNVQEEREKAQHQHSLDVEKEQLAAHHEAQQAMHQHALEGASEERAAAHQLEQEGHEVAREHMQHEREEASAEVAHQRQLEMEGRKARSATNQLRMKGKQAVQVAKAKPGPQPKGGKKR